MILRDYRLNNSADDLNNQETNSNQDDKLRSLNTKINEILQQPTILDNIGANVLEE